MAEFSDQQVVLLDVSGAPTIDDDGHLELDNTVQSEALVLLFGRRGEHYRDRNWLGRLHTIKTVGQAEREFLPMCEEALKPLLDTGRIVRLELGALETWPSGVAAELVIYVTEKEHIKLQVLPIKG